MFSLARNGERFGYCAKDREGIQKYRGWYIDDHVVSEAAIIQQRLWDEVQEFHPSVRSREGCS
jgi:hypothetical protein